ncbi:MAG TPA: DMT family transporter [Pirellulaceae bacterium]|nr:DMT family transporter [Pirellulaceae bacterium]
MPRPAALPYIWMLLGAASFSVMAALTAGLRDQCDWQWIAIARTGLAMIFAASLAVGGGARLVFFRPARLWMRSLAGSISLVCGFYAMTHYPVSEVLTLTNMFPLWVAVLSWPLLGQSPPLDIWPAMLVSLVGIVLMQQPDFQGHSTYLPIGAAVVSSLTSAVAMIGLHQIKQIDPRAIVAHFSAVALAASVAALFVFPTSRPLALDLKTGGLLLGVGVSATIGQLFLTKAFAAGPPARVSVVALAQVGFTMLLEIAFWHRPFGMLTLVGIALVVAPTAWTLLRSAGRPRLAIHDGERVA